MSPIKSRAVGISVALIVSLAAVTVHAASLKPVKITPEWKEAMRKRMPQKPRCAPKAPRKVLLFSLSTGFQHWVTPHTDVIIEQLGDKTGAFSVLQTNDVKMFERERLEKFDAVILNNNCSKGPGRDLFLDVLGDKARAAALEKSVLEFVAGGKGLVAVHGAIVMQNNSAEFSEMVGGSFDFHPAQQEVVLNLVEPDHPLLEAFKGKPLVHIDEPYLFKNAYAKKNFRPLLVMDTGKLNCGNRQQQVVSDVRYCAWIKKHGKGRVFYCSPSHNAQSFEDPRLLQFVLDGIQYALGDLVCDDSVKKQGT
jgi:type 1 glutamine amidotransferase